MGVRSRIGNHLDPGRGRRPGDRRIMGRARLLPRSSFGPAPVELRGRAADVPAGSTARDLRVACGGALDRPSRVRPADRALAGKRKPALGTSDRLARDHARVFLGCSARPPGTSLRGSIRGKRDPDTGPIGVRRCRERPAPLELRHRPRGDRGRRADRAPLSRRRHPYALRGHREPVSCHRALARAARRPRSQLESRRARCDERGCR